MFSRVFRNACRSFSDFRKDYYRELNVGKTASAAEIKAAYHKLAKQWHPDSPSGNADKFKDIAEAYEVLGDTSNRKSYDAARSGGFYGGDQRQSQSYEDIFRQSAYSRRRSDFRNHQQEFWEQQAHQGSTKRKTYTYEKVDPFTGRKTTYTYYEANSFTQEELKRQQEEAEKFFREFFNSRGPFGFDPLRNPYGKTPPNQEDPDEMDDRAYFSTVFKITFAVFTGIVVLNILSRLFFRSDPYERPYHHHEVRPPRHNPPDSLEDSVRRMRFRE
mmetsp:Transcript_22769/g.40956  ORF Transcript_22769/g.40956 Transcript_22769/m.40956 type:complete len:273 (-) Transcript_22769:38-856(-)